MTHEAVRAYYAQFDEREWERLTHPIDGALEYAVNCQLLAAHLPPAGRVLDLGGGPGRYTIWLAHRGYSVTLADLSPNLLAIARERIFQAGIADRVEAIVEADACDLSRWADGSLRLWSVWVRSITCLSRQIGLGLPASWHESFDQQGLPPWPSCRALLFCAGPLLSRMSASTC